MSNRYVDKWQQRGQVCLWQHKFRRTEWNLAADEPACDALLDLFQRMRDAEWPSQRQIAVVRPRVTATDAPGERPARFAHGWTVKYAKGTKEDDHWDLEVAEGEVRLIVGRSRLDELAEAIADVKRGGGDYSIGPDNAPLWIWWWVDA